MNEFPKLGWVCTNGSIAGVVVATCSDGAIKLNSSSAGFVDVNVRDIELVLSHDIVIREVLHDAMFKIIYPNPQFFNKKNGVLLDVKCATLAEAKRIGG